MKIDEQFGFFWKLLDQAASSVGINLSDSASGLMEVHNRMAELEQDFGQEAESEADRLLSETKFGTTKDGVLLLCALGEACMLADGETMYVRDWEPVFPALSKRRTLCDFAQHASIAALRCFEYGNPKPSQSDQSFFSAMGRKGATVKHAPMKELKHWSVRKYKAGQWPSANAAASDLLDEALKHGKTIGANLTKSNGQRTLLLRPDEVLSGILDAAILEVTDDACGVLFERHHVRTGSFT